MKGGGQAVDLCVSVGSGKRNPEPGLADGDGGGTDDTEVKAEVAQLLAKQESAFRLADNPGQNRGAPIGGREWGGGLAEETLAIGVEAMAEAVAFAVTENAEGSGRGCREGRGCAGGEEKGPCAVEEKIDEVAIPGKETSGDAKGLAQGAKLDLDPTVQALVSNSSTTGGPKDAGGVGFIDQKPRSEAVFQISQGTERCPVTVHRKEALRDEKDAGGWRVSASDGLEEDGGFGRIIVGENAEGGSRQPGGVKEAGMGETVEQDEIIRAHEGGNDAEGGHVTGGKEKGGFGLLEFGKVVFEGLMKGGMPPEQAGGPGTGAEIA